MIVDDDDDGDDDDDIWAMEVWRHNAERLGSSTALLQFKETRFPPWSNVTSVGPDNNLVNPWRTPNRVINSREQLSRFRDRLHWDIFTTTVVPSDYESECVAGEARSCNARVQGAESNQCFADAGSWQLLGGSGRGGEGGLQLA
eukprot:783257-Amphidinium_carterae.1